MNKDVKKKWIKALKSGEYRQTTNTLCEVEKNGDRKFCCLGVLTDLYIKEVGDKSWEKYEGTLTPKNKRILGFKETNRYGGNYNDVITGVLPYDVQAWAELDDEDPFIEDTDKTLSELNDAGKSFIEIAKVIKEKL